MHFLLVRIKSCASGIQCPVNTDSEIEVLTLLSPSEHLEALDFGQPGNTEQLFLAEKKIFHLYVLLTIRTEHPHDTYTDTQRPKERNAVSYHT